MQTSPVSPQQAATELLRRRRGRASLAGFVNAIDVPGRPVADDEDGWLFHPIETSVTRHHLVLLEAIERTAAKRHGRLMVFMPPGSAKSTYCSVVAPTYLMGKIPNFRVILASYASDLAKRHGRRARQICRQAGYAGLFNATISAATSAADEWALTNGSEYLAGGILSGITGNRAHLLLIDDPVKGRDEADSQVIQLKTKAAYDDDLLTRLIPGGSVVLVQTRWNEADLAGRILPEDYDGASGAVMCRDGMEWEVLNLPAEAEHEDDPLGRAKGEMLWPEWFDDVHWRIFRSNPRTWAALYQQRPAPDTGGYFAVEKLNEYAIAPSDMVIIGGSDYAVTENGGDYTEHGIVGIDGNSQWYVLDWWYGQTSSEEWVERKIDLMLKWKPALWFGEGGVIQKAMEPILLRRMRQRFCANRLEWLSSITDKPTRARGLQAAVSLGWVHLPTNKPWAARLKDQLAAFPAGAYDDAVDVLSLISRGMDQFGKGVLPEAPKVALPRARLGSVYVRDLEADDEVEKTSRYL